MRSQILQNKTGIQFLLVVKTTALKQQISQELISRWDSQREHFYDDIVHVEASAYAHWTDFLSMLIYAANQGRSGTSYTILRCQPAK